MLVDFSRIKEKQLQSKKTKELFSSSQDLGEFLRFSNFNLYYDSLEPGRRLSSPHKYSAKKELLVVISGFLNAYDGDNDLTLGPGGFYFFDPKDDCYHYAENLSGSEVKVFLIAQGVEEDLVFYQNSSPQ